MVRLFIVHELIGRKKTAIFFFWDPRAQVARPPEFPEENEFVYHVFSTHAMNFPYLCLNGL